MQINNSISSVPLIEEQEAKLASTYFDLIQKVGSDGKYQRNIFILFFTNWFVTSVLIMQTVFLFMNRSYQCISKNLLISECNSHVCKLPETQRDQFFAKLQVKSLVTEFGPYMCDQQPEVDLLKTVEYIGVFFGYIIFLYFADNYGRNFSLLMTWTCTCFGVALIVGALNMQMAVIGLFFAGAGCQTAIRINMSILSQIVDYYKRQTYSVALEVSFGLGSCFIAIMYYLIGHWRIFNIVFVAIPSVIILLFFIYYFQETPKFLMKKERKQALRALNKIGKINKGRDDIITLEDLQNVADQNVDNENFNKTINMLDLFRFKSLRTLTILNMTIFLVISYLYITPAFVVDRFGFNPYISLVVVACSQLIAYPISIIFIRKVKRIESGVVCFTVSIIISVILVVKQKPQDCNGQCFEAYLQIIGVFIARFAVAFYFSIFFVFVNELYPLRARGIGFGIGSAVGSVGSMSGNIVVGYFYQHQINPQILNIFLAILAISALMFLPQTLNVPLKDEIDEITLQKNKVKEVKKSQKSHNNHHLN